MHVLEAFSRDTGWHGVMVGGDENVQLFCSYDFEEIFFVGKARIATARRHKRLFALEGSFLLFAIVLVVVVGYDSSRRHRFALIDRFNCWIFENLDGFSSLG
jgi:hypothetical protein